MILRYVLIFLLLLLIVCVISFLPAPVYRFRTTSPFAGDSIYNPYRGVDSTRWHKANFHAHVSEKPRCNYNEEEFLAAYYDQGYEIVGIADHQFINLRHSDRPGFIPTYEHGFNLNRYHQLLLGTTKQVTPFDYPVMLTRSQMQYMLHHLRPRTELLVLNHPGQTRGRLPFNRNAYSVISGYDLIEFNPDMKSEDATDLIWDTALSNGIYSNLIGNDDSHSITRRGTWFQRCFSRVNVDTLEQSAILQSLREGRAYATFVPRDLNKQEGVHATLPQLRNITLSGDTIRIALSEAAASIRFIGQGGAVLAEATDTAQAAYVVAPNDSYVRIDATFPNGVTLYFNPFVRCADGEQPVQINTAQINYPITVLQKFLWSGLIVGMSLLIRRLWRTRPRRKRKIK